MTFRVDAPAPQPADNRNESVVPTLGVDVPTTHRADAPRVADANPDSAASRYLDRGGPLAGAPADGLGDAILARADRFRPERVDNAQINDVVRVVDGRHGYYLKADSGLMPDQAAHELLAARVLRSVDPALFVPARAADGPDTPHPHVLVMDAADRWPADGGWHIENHADGAPAQPPTDAAEALRLHLFDYTAGNNDRHPRNWLEAVNVDGRRRLVAIDHGACFGGSDGPREIRGADVGYDEWAAAVGRPWHLGGLVGDAYAFKSSEELRADVDATVDRLQTVDAFVEANAVADRALRGRGEPADDTRRATEFPGWLSELPHAASYWQTRAQRLVTDRDAITRALEHERLLARARLGLPVDAPW
ncbi:MAG: hypothetical protein Q8K63_04610 [Acidimicrobiales bacterium]|nr:hypothetical protein [Acidimicrobiales bacterium]